MPLRKPSRRCYLPGMIRSLKNDMCRPVANGELLKRHRCVHAGCALCTDGISQTEQKALLIRQKPDKFGRNPVRRIWACVEDAAGVLHWILFD